MTDNTFPRRSDLDTDPATSREVMQRQVTHSAALDHAASRSRFPWLLSILVECQEVTGLRQPYGAELALLRTFEADLHRQLANGDNAVFVTRMTRAGQHELVWRVRNPQWAMTLIRQALEDEAFPRTFTSHLEEDADWRRITAFTSWSH